MAQQYSNYMAQGIAQSPMMQSTPYPNYNYREMYGRQQLYNAQYPQVYQQLQQHPPIFIPIMSSEDGKGKGKQPSDQGESGSSAKQGPQYLCFYEPCASQGKSFTRKADLERHVYTVHNRDNAELVDCEEPGCHRKGNYGFPRKDKMVEHMREVHKSDKPKRPPGKRSP